MSDKPGTPIPTKGQEIGPDGVAIVRTDGLIVCPRCDGRTAVNTGTDEEPNWTECPKCGGAGRAEPHVPTDQELVAWRRNARPIGSSLVRSYTNSLGEEVHEVYVDSFREPKRRDEGWLEEAYASGAVRRPGDLDPDEGKDYSKAKVVEVPLARLVGVAHELGG